MPAERIAANLAYINWTVLTGLAVGTIGAVVLGRLRTEATRGFLAFSALCAALFGLLAYVSDTGLPAVPAAVPEPTDPVWDPARRLALAAFVILALAYTLALARRRRAARLGLATVAVGVAAWVAAAAGWADGPLGSLLLFVQFLVLGAATGGVFASMILGHWYLVTPKLPEAPLVLYSRLLLGIVALQLALFAIWAAVGAGATGFTTGGGSFGVLVGPWALFAWLRLIVGLAFPLIVTWAALQTARTRSMESATGLLYIDVGAIAAGTILAAGLYFGAGILV